MLSSERPGHNSSRIQRASRLNGIEQTRLHWKLQLLEKEKVHTVRVTNQDIRLVSLTLDYIQACSGRSPEGVVPVLETVPEEDDLGPCFLYGERLVSRRVKRPGRAQSTLPGRVRRDSDIGSVLSLASTATTILSTTKAFPRPQSSPPGKLRGSGVWYSEDEIDTGPVSTGRLTPEHAWTDEPSPITKKIFRAQSGDIEKRGTVFSSASTPHRERSQRAMSRVMRTQATLATLPAATAQKTSRKSSFVYQRGARVSDILNTADVHVMSAGAWKKYLRNKKGSPVRYAEQRQTVMAAKKDINDNKTKEVTSMISQFLSRHPTKRYSTPILN